MFSMFLASFRGLESSLRDFPTTIIAKPNQERWQRAFVTIYCSRAFSSPLRNAAAITKSTAVSSNRVVAIDVFEPHPCFSEIDQSVLTRLVKEKKLDQLVGYGGVGGIASALKTSFEDGIHGDDEDVSNRKQAFGTNTYRRPPSKNLFHFMWEALRDPTILILCVCAALSLGFGIKENGPKEGWYGGSIFVAVFLVIAVSTLSNFRQNRQFVKLSKISNNIQVDVIRMEGGNKSQFSKLLLETLFA